LAGATRLGDTHGNAFAEATMLTSGTVGQDLFSSLTRSQTLPKKLYAGIMWAEPESGRFARIPLR
jgi:hypothetical protein